MLIVSPHWETVLLYLALCLQVMQTCLELLTKCCLCLPRFSACDQLQTGEFMISNAVDEK